MKTKGCIINISSYFSKWMVLGIYSSAYSLTKGTIDSFTKSLASELGPSGVQVNAIALGSVKTPLFDAAIAEMTVKERKRFNHNVESMYPLGRIGNPSDVSGMAVLLASEQSKWITGSLVSVDGVLTTK